MMNPKSIHHRVMFSDLTGCVPPQLITIEGPEAQHLAKVKRARVGEMVGVLDGIGSMGIGEIAEISGSKQRPIIAVMLDHIEMIPPVSPRIQICCPAPKGDRLDRMIDQLTQIGIESWVPLISDRSERDPTAIRQDRLTRIIHEACKQCVRTRSLVIHEPMTLAQAIQNNPMRVVVCDGSGNESLASLDVDTRILIGPEGGWSDEERSRFATSKIQIARLGVHVLRLETAAAVAGSLALANSIPPTV
tara:strand:- start:135726 stop:136466 length:741 start_codon:yes stop_codon:yes gene_type:complete